MNVNKRAGRRGGVQASAMSMDAHSGAADAMSEDARARCAARLSALSAQALLDSLVVALFDGRDAALKRIADEAPLFLRGR